jgi:D-Tyr-tRNAtyr deacylase
VAVDFSVCAVIQRVAEARVCVDRLYEYFPERLRAAGLKVANGQFQAHMQIAMINDGPVTLVLEF